MHTTGDPVAALLTDLARHGIELQAHGDRLRFWPRSAMTPGLAQRVKAHKPELLALLGNGRAPEPAQNGRNPALATAAAQSGTIGQRHATQRPQMPEQGTPPHELSLAERIESGYVNPGWTPAAWAARLQQLADRCEAIRPELAAQYRAWAANVRENERGLA